MERTLLAFSLGAEIVRTVRGRLVDKGRDVYQFLGSAGGLGAADARVVNNHKDSVAAAKKGKTVMEPEPQHNDNNHSSQSHDYGQNHPSPSHGNHSLQSHDHGHSSHSHDVNDFVSYIN